MTRNISKCKNGFSLIEALVAIGILIVGILSAFLLLIRTTSTIPAMQERLRAVNLAQEGIELVRALRDSDFIHGDTFKFFLNGHSCEIGSGCHITANASGDIELFDGPGGTLKFNDSTYLYTYDHNDSDSIFLRKIIIDNIQADFIDVTAEVKYSVKGKEYKITATDRLYNWLNP